MKALVFLPVLANLLFYAFTWACLLGVFGFLALLLRSRFGRALAGIKVNEQRSRTSASSATTSRSPGT